MHACQAKGSLRRRTIVAFLSRCPGLHQCSSSSLGSPEKVVELAHAVFHAWERYGILWNPWKFWKSLEIYSESVPRHPNNYFARMYLAISNISCKVDKFCIYLFWKGHGYVKQGQEKCWYSFNENECIPLHHLLDLGPLTFAPSKRDMSGTMGFSEFKELSQVLNGWRATFGSYDRDRSGTVEGQEMQLALTSMGKEGAVTESTHHSGHHPAPPNDGAPSVSVCLSLCLQVTTWAHRPWTWSWGATASAAGSPSTTSSAPALKCEHWRVSGSKSQPCVCV